MKTVHVVTLPPCALCTYEEGMTVPARYDSPVDGGRWGYLCERHMETRGNTGLASRLSDEPEPERSKADVRRDIYAAIDAGNADEVWDLVGDGDLLDFL